MDTGRVVADGSRTRRVEADDVALYFVVADYARVLVNFNTKSAIAGN